MEAANTHPPPQTSVEAVLGLRQRAEAVLADKISGSMGQAESASPQTTQQLLHELQVHQIELEIENEELRRAQAALDTSRERYLNLYDLAPMGYCTVTEKGLISQVNLSISTLLGMPRSQLIKQPITRFIFKEDQDIFYKLCHHLLERGEQHSCELRLTRQDGVSFWVHLAVTLAQDETGLQELRLVVNDISRIKLADECIRQNESDLRALFDASLDAVIGMDEQGCITDWNKRAETIFGWRKDEAMGRMLHDTLAPAHRRAEHHLGRARFLATGQTEVLNRRIEMTALRRSGEEFPVELSILSFQTSHSYRFTAFIADISERKRIEAALQESEQKFRLIAENTSDGITIFDKDGHVQYVSPSVCKQLGYSEQEELGRSGADIYSIVYPEGRDALFQEIKEAIQAKKEWLTYSYRVKHKSGHYIWREDSTNFRYANSGEYDGAYVVSRDISLRKRMEEELHQLACFDPLTQLPNRHTLSDRISQTMSASKRSVNYAALLMLDLDNFKPLNDAHGHHAGDLLLVEVARRLTECVRETDTVARVGGDEFVVILGELDVDPKESARQAAEVAEKIRTSLAAPYRLVLDEGSLAGCEVQHLCSASIGVVLFLGHEVSQEDLMKRADSAMYRAKEAGRNAIRFR